MPEHLFRGAAHTGVENARCREVRQTPLAEFDRKDIHEADGDQEDRHRKADERQCGQRVVEPRVLLERRDEAQPQPDDDDQHLRTDGQNEGVWNAIHHDVEGRLIGDDGLPEVAAQNPLPRAGAVRCAITVSIHQRPVVADQPVEILGHDGLIQAQLAAQTLTISRAGRKTSAHDGQRVAC